MQLTAAQLRDFDEQGYLFFPDCYLTLCAVSNHITKFTRPEWIVHRDFTPLVPVADEALITHARSRRVAVE